MDLIKNKPTSNKKLSFEPESEKQKRKDEKKRILDFEKVMKKLFLDRDNDSLENKKVLSLRQDEYEKYRKKFSVIAMNYFISHEMKNHGISEGNVRLIFPKEKLDKISDLTNKTFKKKFLSLIPENNKGEMKIPVDDFKDMIKENKSHFKKFMFDLKNVNMDMKNEDDTSDIKDGLLDAIDKLKDDGDFRTVRNYRSLQKPKPSI